MTSSPSASLNYGGYIASVPTVAVLRSTVDPVSYPRNSTIIVLGNEDIGDQRGGVYAWMPDSLATDDDYSIIEPLVVNGGPGRWLLSVGAASSVAAVILAQENEQAQRISGDSTLSASITTEQSARIDGDAAIAERTSTLESDFSTLTSTVDGVKADVTTTKARISTEETTRASADEALSQRITSLQSTFTNSNNSSNASVTDEATARASADDALAQQINTVSASLTTVQNTLNASVEAETTARTNADGALTSQITNLTATTTAAQNNLSARITDEASARSTADSSLANRVSTVEATTNSMSASVTETSNAVSSLNGKTAAYWQVSSVAGNNRAQLTIHADANGGAGVDIVGDVGISGSLTVDGTVTTKKLYQNAVSNGDAVAVTNSFVGQGGVSTSTTGYTVGSWQNVATYTATLTDAARLMVQAAWKQSYISGSRDDDRPAAARVLIDGTTVLDEYWGTVTQDKVPMLGSVDLSAGSHTIAIQWQGASSVMCYHPRLLIEWFYK